MTFVPPTTHKTAESAWANAAANQTTPTLGFLWKTKPNIQRSVLGRNASFSASKFKAVTSSTSTSPSKSAISCTPLEGKQKLLAGFTLVQSIAQVLPWLFLTFILLSAVDCKTERRNYTSSCRANCGTSRTWQLWEKIVTYGAHGGKQDCSEKMIEEGNCNLDPCHSQPPVGPTSSPAGPTIAPGDQGL